MRDYKYKKKCSNCGRGFGSNYENSQPCHKCGRETIEITHIDGTPVCDIAPPDKPSPVARPVITRTVLEQWKGDTYTVDRINGNLVSSVETHLQKDIDARERLNKRIHRLRYQLNWHNRRLEKGAFN